jgi:hypothetical protein
MLPLNFFPRFSRGSVQTILPPYKNRRAGRLCSSVGEKIAELINEANGIEKIKSEKSAQRKKLVSDQQNLEQNIRSLKVKFLLMCNSFELSHNFSYCFVEKTGTRGASFSE